MRTQARFPGVERGAGHYESFYIKATDPSGGRGVWIRQTVNKRPGEEPEPLQRLEPRPRHASAGEICVSTIRIVKRLTKCQ